MIVLGYSGLDQAVAFAQRDPTINPGEERMDPDHVALQVRERSGLDVQAVTLVRSGAGDELVLENHLIDSREGSSGARGARGGGCGCN